MMISVNDLLIFLGVFFGACLVVAVGVMLIVTLVNISRAAKRLTRLIDDNAAPLGRAIRLLPGVAESVEKAGASVKVNADRVGTSFGAIEAVFAGTPGDETGTLQTIVGIAESILKLIMGYFAGKDKD